MRTLVVIVAGAAGAGKTTVGRRLASQLGWGFLEGDAFHPPHNIEKMASGLPLDETDREPWLREIAATVQQAIRLNRPIVITCSALKKAYRSAIGGNQRGVEVVFLKVASSVLRERLRGRSGHFFPAGLLESQLEILQEPERGLTVDASGTPAEIVKEIQEWLTDLPRT